MSAIKHIKGTAVAVDCRIAIVMSGYNSFIGERLLKGCLKTLAQRGVNESNITLVQVPGAFEIPIAAKRLAATNDYDAVITLGAVIRGETAHFDLICMAYARALAELALEMQLPLIFGVLTVDNKAQALARSADAESNKGSECADAALEMISVLRQIG